MKRVVCIALLLVAFFTIETFPGRSPDSGTPKRPLKIGYSVPLKSITNEKMQHAKSVGIDYIEIGGFESLIDTSSNFVLTDDKIRQRFLEVRGIVEEAGIKVWSIHMPGIATTDISTFDEKKRISVVNMHLKLLDFLEILEPQIFLFHASHFVPPSEREFRKGQAVKSAITLNEKVKQIRGTMVIENGGGNTAHQQGVIASVMPRSIEEILAFMNRLPVSIGAAVDMNHLPEPHKLITALGDRLKSVHINDGNGQRCYHYFPCSGEGENDWTKILAALDAVNYNGPFMYESKYEDEKDLVDCYKYLYDQYVLESASWDVRRP